MKLRNIGKFIQNLEELDAVVVTEDGEISVDRLRKSRVIQDREIKYIQIVKERFWKAAKVIVYI